MNEICGGGGFEQHVIDDSKTVTVSLGHTSKGSLTGHRYAGLF
jgi:hypothetical protein